MSDTEAILLMALWPWAACAFLLFVAIPAKFIWMVWIAKREHEKRGDRRE